MIFNHASMDSYVDVVTQQLLVGLIINQRHRRRDKIEKNLIPLPPNIHNEAFPRLIKLLSLSALGAL